MVHINISPGVIKWILSYNTPGKASYLATFFYQLGGMFVSWRGSLIVGGVVLRSDALARALKGDLTDVNHDGTCFQFFKLLLDFWSASS